MRTKLALIALVAPLLMLSGCGGSKHAATFDGPVVPWTPAQPAQLAQRSPVSTPCQAHDLAVHGGEVSFSDNGRGGAIAVIALKNTGTQVCRLDGRPQVRLVHKGEPKQVDAPLARPPLIFPDTAYPLSSLKAIRPGEYVGLTVTWTNWCDPEIPGKKRVAPSAVRITLANGTGAVDSDYNAVPQCLDPSKPSTLAVSPWETAKVTPTPPWAPNDGAIRATVIDQPVEAARGGLLHYVVVLKNTSRAPVRFDRCPSYVQQLVPAGQVEVHALNCRAAKPIAPGGSEAFAMQVRVPKNAPIGGNGLFWALDPFGAKAPQLNARATIARAGADH